MSYTRERMQISRTRVSQKKKSCLQRYDFISTKLSTGLIKSCQAQNIQQ